jgi:hypothetical protein
MFLTLFKSIVGPHLEHGSNVWSVIYKKEAMQIENLQRRATTLVKIILLCEKLYFLIFVLLFFLYIFWLWPLVAVRLIGKMCSCCTLSMLLRILKVSTMSQKPIKQPLEKSGDKILTRCLPTGGTNQPIKKGPRG